MYGVARLIFKAYLWSYLQRGARVAQQILRFEINDPKRVPSSPFRVSQCEMVYSPAVAYQSQSGIEVSKLAE